MKMISHEEIITRILSLHSNLTREDIQNMVKKKRESTGQLLTEEGALYMVANELGIDISSKRDLTKIFIKDVITGASDITVTGQIISVFPVKVFKKSSGAEGRVARFVISDETGVINIVLWDEKTIILNQGKLEQNQYITVSHGYVKAGLNGKPEIHVGKRGNVTILSKTNTHVVPVEHFKKICDLKETDLLIDLVGMIKQVSPISFFDRRNGITGQVRRVTLDDGTGRINIVLWDDKVDAVGKIQKNDYVKLINGEIRKNIVDTLEIHMGKFSQITILDEKPKSLNVPYIALTKIGELKPKMQNTDVLGRAIEIGQIREFNRSSGEIGRVGDLFLIDETGSIRLSLWDDKVETLKNVIVNDVVLVEGAYTREGTFGIGLNLGRLGSITINPDMAEAKKLPESSSKLSLNINQLKVGSVNVTIQGVISEEPKFRTVTTKDGQEVSIASLRIKDQTGEIKVTLWRDLAEQIENIMLGTAIKIKNAYIRTGLDGTLELSSRYTTEIEILSKSDEDEKELYNMSKLDDVNESKEKLPLLKNDVQATNIYGKIIEIEARVYSLCPSCGKKVHEKKGEWICKECGIVTQLKHELVVNSSFEDSSKKIHATIFRGEVAEELLGITADYAWNIAAQTGDKNIPIEIIGTKILGKKLNVIAKIKTRRLIVEKINNN